MGEDSGATRVSFGRFAGPVELWWDDEMSAWLGEACYLGQIFAGFIEAPGVDRRWRGWVQTADCGQLLGNFPTKAEAKQAVCDAVLKCAEGTFTVEISP